MKKIVAASLCLLLFSCFNNHAETERLNQRITLLEQRLDSLTGNTNPVRSNNSYIPAATSYGMSYNSARCQALTKKGKQCKRNAKSNSYCWQHGG